MSFQQGISGLNAASRNLEVIGNNIANANTVGGKSSRAEFSDVYANVSANQWGVSTGMGVRVSAVTQQFTQGSIRTTDNPMDMAINGRGFFRVTQPGGEAAYTRNGQFHLSRDGEIVNADGLVIQPSITIPQGAQSLTIGKDGTVSVVLPGEPEAQQIGSLTVTDFINPAGLEAIGGNLFLETTASGSPTNGTPGLDGLGTIEQGNLENSNVEVVEELVNMITTQRAYEMNAKVISTSDQMLQFISQNL